MLNGRGNASADAMQEVADLHSLGRVGATQAARCVEKPASLQHSPELQHRRTLATYA